MNRILASLVLLLTFTLVPVLGASVWTPVAERALLSVVFLEALDAADQPMGFCSGFVINTDKKYVLTAAHCDGQKVLVNGTPSYRMFKDARKDLMVLRASHLVDMPAIGLASINPKIGEEVAALGYGFALEKPMVRFSHISITNLEIEGLSGPFIMVDAGYIPGQSGGAVINDKGLLVSIIQRGSDGLGIGVGAEVIKEKVGRFFQEAK